MSHFSPIHHTFGPLADSRQVVRSLGMILTPWNYFRGASEQELTKALAERFKGESFLLASGREALVMLFRAMKLSAGEEVVVQAYTCVVLPNAIHAAGGTPVFAEIDRDTLNLTVDSVKAVLTPRTRAVICQHTFGIPAPVAELKKLCEEKKILLIEDCAHVIPDSKGHAEITAHGDALMFSFGRDKAISGVSGGCLIARKPELTQKLRELSTHASDLPLPTILRLLLYPLFYTLARPLYGLMIGKAALKMLQMLHLLVPILSREEKEGMMPLVIHRMPNGLAYLALDQWKRLDDINMHRRKLTAFYRTESERRGWPRVATAASDLPLQKYPLFLEGAERIRRSLKKKNIHLNDGWPGCVICPDTVALAATGYVPGSDPQAEETCERILALPTHPGMSLKQARRLVDELDALTKELGIRS